MSKRTGALMLVLVIFCGMAVSMLPVKAAAYTDDVDEMAQAWVTAITSGQSTCKFTSKEKNITVVLNRIFDRYPMLIHFYQNGEYLTYDDHLEITIHLHRTEDDLSELWVVGSDTELMAAVGLGLLQVQKEIKFITKNGYIPTEEALDAALEKLHYEYYVPYMGYWSRGIGYVEYGNCREYTITFLYFCETEPGMMPDGIRRWKQDTESVVLTLLHTLIAQDMPESQKALLIHDWVINNCRYNVDDMDYQGNNVAYGPLLGGYGVCMGYAEAALLLFRAAGLEAYYLTGYATDSTGETGYHAWNTVKIDGEWYHVDLTWDDPVNENGEQTLRYDYFLLTDSQMAKDHTWDAGDVPPCNGTAWNADKALAASARDTHVYTQYGTGQYISLKQAETRFRGTLTSSAVLMEAFRQENTPVETTRPVPPMPTENPEKKTEEQTEKQKDVTLGWIVVPVGVFAVCVFAVSGIQKRNARKRRGKYRKTTSVGNQHYVDW